MTDTTAPTPAGAPSPSTPSHPYKNRRARRALALVLVILIILLGVSAYLLYRVTTVPTSKSAGAKVDTKGIEWVRSIYGTSNRLGDMFGQTSWRCRQ